MSIRFVPRNRPRAGRLFLFAGALSCAAFLFSAQPPSVGAAICPPPDPDVCLAQCYRHKRECWQTCNTRKRQCISEARLEAKACRLGCRETQDGEDVGICKRRCVATALHHAVKQCKLGRPVCMKLCNPRNCDRRCDAYIDGLTEICEPPSDLECLGVCAREYRGCLETVHEDGRICASECSQFRGERRYVCLHECADKTRVGSARCGQGFRDCSASCSDVLTDGEPEVAPATD